ncbi:TPA: hypothetical protein EYP37_09185 [Candidatus Poribacteria bacterium]|nr:hypothetical protein [Candidatus Poribacteria bacterium]
MRKLSATLIISALLLIAFGISTTLSAEPEYMKPKAEEEEIRKPPPEKVRGRIEEIRKRIKEIKAKGRPRTDVEERVKELRDQLARTERRLEELRGRNPDSPEIRELERKADELRSKIRKLEEIAKHMPPPPKMPPIEEAVRMKGELRIFKLKHIPPGYAADIVGGFKSRLGMVVPVEPINLLIVRDIPEYLADIEEIIHHIDVPQLKRPPRRPAERRQRVRERAERPKREIQPRRQVFKGEFNVKPGEEHKERVFANTDRPVPVTFKPVLKGDEVELKIKWGDRELVGRSKLNMSAELMAHPDPKRADWGIEYEVIPAEGDRLKVKYRAWRVLPRTP